MNQAPFEDLREAAEHLRQAADGVARRMLGGEVQDELRQAGLHVVRAARRALEQAEDCFAQPHGEGKPHSQQQAESAPPEAAGSATSEP